MEQSTVSAKPASRPKNRFDLEDRERVRAALLAYAKRRGIGVPTLQSEIATAHNIDLDRLPLSTLQRFLAGKHRTHDAFVRLCYDFCERLPAEDLAGHFPGALRTFFGGVSGDAEHDALPSRLQSHVQERALLKAKPTASEDGPRILKMATPMHDIRYSELICSSHGGAIHVQERLLNWACRGDPPEDADVARSYEGAAQFAGHGGVIVLRNLLTGTPRTYVLARDENGALVGRASEPITLLGETSTYRGEKLVDTLDVIITALEEKV